MTDCLAVGQNGGDARHGWRDGTRKDEAMKQRSDKTAAARENQKLAEGLRTVKGLGEDSQEALYGIASLLGGLELIRCAAESASTWGSEERGLPDELAEHLDAAAAVLEKYRDGILRGWPEAATA